MAPAHASLLVADVLPRYHSRLDGLGADPAPPPLVPHEAIAGVVVALIIAAGSYARWRRAKGGAPPPTGDDSKR